VHGCLRSQGAPRSRGSRQGGAAGGNICPVPQARHVETRGQEAHAEAFGVAEVSATPFTPAQRRLFAVQYRNGELSKREFDKRMAEGTRTDVDRSGHAKGAKRSKKRSGKR